MASAEVKRPHTSSTAPNMSGGDQAESHRQKHKENWRLTFLANPKSPREKYEKPDETFHSGVNPGALIVDLSERNEHLSRPPLRTLVINKREFSTLPTTFPNYEQRMNQKIEHTWNSIYNYYKKAKRDLSIKSKTSKQKPSKKTKGKTAKVSVEKGKKGKKGKGKEKDTGKAEIKSACSEKSEEEIEKERAIWVSLRSAPKTVHRPEPINRGPIVDLEEIQHRMTELATPRTVTLKFSEQPVIDTYKIKEETLTYEPTERVLELAKPPQFWSIKQESLIPGAVKPGALQAIASPRILELSVPRETVNARDSDLKEDPFVISPNALKYVATARVVELAKPISRK